MSKQKIAFQGELGANSHEACCDYFPTMEPLPCPTFDEAFESIKSGNASLGMIPIENSLAGRVADVHCLLPTSGLKIVGERFKSIRLHVMANPGVMLDDVRVIQSMPVALGQCRRALRRLGVRTEPFGDTAGAARFLHEYPDSRRAVIASTLAAELYGLNILQRNVEDEHNNTTRFLVMTGETHPQPPPVGDKCITSFVFRVRNVPAALYKALSGFATNGVNMIKLESYMESARFTSTLFYAEVDGRPEDRTLTLALQELAFFSKRIEILGVFSADPYRSSAANELR